MFMPPDGGRLLQRSPLQINHHLGAVPTVLRPPWLNSVAATVKGHADPARKLARNVLAAVVVKTIGLAAE
ncbi:MAG TPA: hypothetical protein VE196_06750 [Pseudonocardiaceae bacterium]|nr:hypothetical protein [Pseudonocardiaceae bacterium]